MRQNWRGVVIHHTAGPDSDRLEMDDIEKLHKSGNGWAGIGYHFVVERIDSSYVAIMGRPMNTIGAHCKQHNRLYLGVALVGDFTVAPPPDAQLQLAAKLVAALLDQHFLPRDQIYRHSDLRPTECPGKAFPWAKFRALVAGA